MFFKDQISQTFPESIAMFSLDEKRVCFLSKKIYIIDAILCAYSVPPQRQAFVQYLFSLISESAAFHLKRYLNAKVIGEGLKVTI